MSGIQLLDSLVTEDCSRTNTSESDCQAKDLGRTLDTECYASSSAGSSSIDSEEEDNFQMYEIPQVPSSMTSPRSQQCETPRKVVNLLDFASCNVHNGKRQPHVQNQLLCQQLPPWQLLTETRQLRKLLAAVQEERKGGSLQPPESNLSEELEKARAELQAKERQLLALAHSRDRAEQDAAWWQQAAMTPRCDSSEHLARFSPQTMTPRSSATPLSPRSNVQLHLPIRVKEDAVHSGIQVIFQICCAETFFKEEIVVVGDHELLGNWNPQAAHALQTSGSSYPKWQSKYLVSFPGEGPLALRYKYVRDGSSRRGGYGWEELIPDRETIILKPLPPGRAWLIRDIAFNYEEVPHVTQIELSENQQTPAIAPELTGACEPTRPVPLLSLKGLSSLQ